VETKKTLAEWLESLHLRARSSYADITTKECGELRQLLMELDHEARQSASECEALRAQLRELEALAADRAEKLRAAVLVLHEGNQTSPGAQVEKREAVIDDALALLRG
jgi:multidrug efflux pump subunit AcrA (membrane-fusion protein)